MMRKRWMSAVLLGAFLAAACTGCGGQNGDAAGLDAVDREIELTLEAYQEDGGMLRFTDEDGNVIETGSIGALAAEGETVESAMTACGYLEIEAFREGDTLEGWMECVVVTDVDEYGFETTTLTALPDQIYSTEELMALPVSADGGTYVAKWAGIDAEDYYTAEDVWDDSSSSGSFSLSANGGSMTFLSIDETELRSPVYTYWLESGWSLNDVMGTEYDTLTAVEKEGAEFTGWTVYEADSAWWNSESVNEDGITSFLYNEEYEDVRYLLLKNAVILYENLSTEELCGLCMEDGKSCFAAANWNE